MKFELVKNIDKTELYGDIPCLPCELDSDVGERFLGEESDSWLLLNDFVPEIDKICKNTLDYGDVDFFDASKCVIIKGWIEMRKRKSMSERLMELYDQLYIFVLKAIELDTGVVIEL